MAHLQLPHAPLQPHAEHSLRAPSTLDAGWATPLSQAPQQARAPPGFSFPQATPGMTATTPATPPRRPTAHVPPRSPAQLLDGAAAAASPGDAWAGLGFGLGFGPASLYGHPPAPPHHPTGAEPWWLLQPVSPWEQPAVGSFTGPAVGAWGAVTVAPPPLTATAVGHPMTTAALAEPPLQPLPPQAPQAPQVPQAGVAPSRLTPAMVQAMLRVDDIRAALADRGLDISGYKVALRRRLWLAVGGADPDPGGNPPKAPAAKAPAAKASAAKASPRKTPAAKAAGRLAESLASDLGPAKRCPANAPGASPKGGRRSTQRGKHPAALPAVTFGPWKAGPSECGINSRIPDELLGKILGLIASAKGYGRAVGTCRRWRAIGGHAAVRASFGSEIRLLKYAAKMTAPALAGGGPCSDAVVAAAFSPTGDELFGGLDDDDGTVRVWDSSPGADLAWVATVEHHEGVTALAVTADSLIVGTFEGSIACWDTSADVIAPLWTVAHDREPVCCTALSGSISTALTGLSWICVGIHSRRALPCPVCA